MGVKLRFAAVLMLLMLVLSTGMAAGAQSSVQSVQFELEQARIHMPEITVYFRSEQLEEIASGGDFSATLGGVPLSLVEAGPSASLGDDILYIFLVDCSTSVTVPQINGIKETLRRFAAEKNENESMMLIGFGKEATILLSGGESSGEIEAAIDRLSNNQDGTVLFDAMGKALDYSEHEIKDSPLRKVGVVFSDAEDFAVGSYTYEEALSRLTAQSVPLYAVGFNTGTKASLDALGVLCRSSGGGIHVTHYDEIAGSTEKILNTVRGSGVVKFRAPTNEVSRQPETLSVQLELGGTLTSRDITVVPRYWVEDRTIPEVQAFEQSSEGEVKLWFSEPVYGADNPENYKLGDGTEEHRAEVATYLEGENAVALTFGGLSGTDCTIAFMNITDRSMERNPVGPYAFTNTFPVEKDKAGGDIIIQRVEGEPQSLAWVPFVAILLVAAVVIIVLLVRKSTARKMEPVPVQAPVAPPQAAPSSVRPQPGVEASHHFATQEVQALRMVVTDHNGMAHKVDVKVNGSLFVGSSHMCNLYFDDPQLAQQHFVIEAEGGLFFLQDLESLGGTFVNGVRVQGRRRLDQRDTISAGQVTFSIL